MSAPQDDSTGTPNDDSTGTPHDDSTGTPHDDSTGTPHDAKGGRYAIVVARFYEELAERLVDGAAGAFKFVGAEHEVFDVSGAFELPLAAAYAVDSGRFDGVVCLGAVIRGETDHYDFVCAEAARGIQEVALGTRTPCAFGVLTCETMDQALARSGGGKRDQGRHAAEAVIAMTVLRRQLGSAGTWRPLTAAQ
ncbi:MAG TPA: 6,7-dimethyl-8-ribityllumazine synthase [Solirubrobacteraceae bacterium]|jgi:6,7-dimethyl-8-ribityllumazine synthase